MSKKFSITTADFLSWDQIVNLIRKLYDDQNYTMALFVSLGSFWGLRASDILNLKWNDIVYTDNLILVERKTKKRREIRITPQLRKHIIACYEALKPASLEQSVFISQKKTIYSIQRINVLLKKIKLDYNLKIKNISTHTFRKSFGREIFNLSGSNAELSLVKLAQIFNHSNTSITRRYLGIAKEEMLQTYEVLKF